ncbi:hypothetical protein V3H18_00335 [Methylocystis sp. 9N]|uniref:Class I SAM-dependent methyltransferase n=1 Tax=Methylocystis borbori TaxID=3118750 RepID=A0ABU7XCV3_9HYPH
MTVEPDKLMFRAGRKLRRLGLAALAFPFRPRDRKIVPDLRRGLPALGQRLAPPYFHGVYGSMAEAARDCGNPFDSAPWVETAEFVTRSLLARTRSANFVVDVHLIPFATLVADLAARRNHVRVLDFGGGQGDNFIQLQAAIDDSLKSKIEYHIVDTPNNCKAGELLLAEFGGRVSFHRADPDHGVHYEPSARGVYDITMLCGTLMYIDGWKELLADLAARTSDYLYITRTLHTSAAPTFYANQFIVPSVGPWAGKYIGRIATAIISPAEIEDLAAREGFTPSLDALLFAYDHRMSSNAPPYNQIFQAMTCFSKRPPLNDSPEINARLAH